MPAEKAVCLADPRVAVMQEYRNSAPARRQNRRQRCEGAHAEQRLRPQRAKLAPRRMVTAERAAAEFKERADSARRRHARQRHGRDAERGGDAFLSGGIGAGEQQQRPAAPLLQSARHGEPGVEMSAGSAAGDGQCQFGHHSSSLRFRYWRNQGRKESFARIEF